VVEAVEGAFGPALTQARHQRDGSIPMPREIGDDGVTVLDHQPRVGLRIAHFDARHQADVREPRRSAEGRGVDEGRNGAATGVANSGTAGASGVACCAANSSSIAADATTATVRTRRSSIATRTRPSAHRKIAYSAAMTIAAAATTAIVTHPGTAVVIIAT